MKFFASLFTLWNSVAFAQHQMQHGFILSRDDNSAHHLVATGHHSHQVAVTGYLEIQDRDELAFYNTRKLDEKVYFVLQAQNLDLPFVQVGDVLAGHIIESEVGKYQPTNRIVTKATFVVQSVLLNVANPFFKEQTKVSGLNGGHYIDNRTRDKTTIAQNRIPDGFIAIASGLSPVGLEQKFQAEGCESLPTKSAALEMCTSAGLKECRILRSWVDRYCNPRSQRCYC